ncbi:MAG: hypothetical protein AAF468_10105 [Pseudomonadota bacterium]
MDETLSQRIRAEAEPFRAVLAVRSVLRLLPRTTPMGSSSLDPSEVLEVRESFQKAIDLLRRCQEGAFESESALTLLERVQDEAGDPEFLIDLKHRANGIVPVALLHQPLFLDRPAEIEDRLVNLSELTGVVPESMRSIYSALEQGASVPPETLDALTPNNPPLQDDLPEPDYGKETSTELGGAVQEDKNGEEVPKFTSKEELREWLENQPIEFAQVMAARAALRVLPIAVHFEQQDEFNDVRVDEIAQCVFRALLISQAATRYFKRDLTTAAGTAAHATATAAKALEATTRSGSAAVLATVDVLNSADRAVWINHRPKNYLLAADSVLLAAYAVSFARNADRREFPNGAEEMWRECKIEAVNMLQDDRASKLVAIGLVDRPLWLDGKPPEQIAVALERLTKIEEQSSNWNPWLEWYICVLEGTKPWGLNEPYAEELTLKIAKQPNDFWDQGAEVVNAQIAQWLEDHRNQQALENAQNPVLGNA